MNYLILSLKWSPGHTGFAVWWRPDNGGYTEDINQAGRYTRQQIDEKPGYYNDGSDTLAVPESEAVEKAREVRLASLSQFTVKTPCECKGTGEVVTSYDSLLTNSKAYRTESCPRGCKQEVKS